MAHFILFTPAKRLLSFIVAAILISACTVLFMETTRAQEASLSEFILGQIRFDESTGGNRPTPTIPKTWKFIGVSNGEKVNSNLLWFQDKDGNIYVLSGFTTYGRFILSSSIQKLSAK